MSKILITFAAQMPAQLKLGVRNDPVLIPENDAETGMKKAIVFVREVDSFEALPEVFYGKFRFGLLHEQSA